MLVRKGADELRVKAKREMGPWDEIFLALDVDKA